MKRIVTLRVTVRPHAESIELDGQIYKDPEDLWAALHRGAATRAGSPERVTESVFLDGASLSAAMRKCIQAGGRVPQKELRHEIIARHSGGVEIRRILSPDTQISQSRTDKSLEELDL